VLGIGCAGECAPRRSTCTASQRASQRHTPLVLRRRVLQARAAASGGASHRGRRRVLQRPLPLHAGCGHAPAKELPAYGSALHRVQDLGVCCRTHSRTGEGALGRARVRAAAHAVLRWQRQPSARLGEARCRQPCRAAANFASICNGLCIGGNSNCAKWGRRGRLPFWPAVG